MARRRTLTSVWAKSWQRSVSSLTSKVVKQALRAGHKALAAPKAEAVKKRKKAAAKSARPPDVWLAGVAVGAAGARAYKLYRPPGLRLGERRPLLVMLHGCAQTAAGFAASTRMNWLAARERFWVLYPEQDRLANPQGCWQWFEVNSGRAEGEIALLLRVIDQVCQLYPVDAGRIAVAGLSAGASMAALLALKAPERFKAVIMHSGLAPGLARSKGTALAAMQGRRVAAPLAGHDLPPLMVIQGGADPLVAPSNGAAAARLWAAASAAVASAPRTVQRCQRYPMTVTDFKLGRRVQVSQIDIARLGHAWSGGAAGEPFSDPLGPDAARLVWAFAARQCGIEQTVLTGAPNVGALNRRVKAKP